MTIQVLKTHIWTTRTLKKIIKTQVIHIKKNMYVGLNYIYKPIFFCKMFNFFQIFKNCYTYKLILAISQKVFKNFQKKKKLFLVIIKTYILLFSCSLIFELWSLKHFFNNSYCKNFIFCAPIKV